MRAVERDRHVEHHADLSVDPNEVRAGSRGSPDGLRSLGREVPRDVLGHDPAGRVNQPGGNGRRVGGASSKRHARREHIDGAVQPLSRSGDRRVDEERDGQVRVARIGERHQRDDRSVEHDEDRAVDGDACRSVNRKGLRYREVADRPEAERVRLGQRLTVLARRGRGDRNPVLRIALPLCRGEVPDRSLVAPLEPSWDVWKKGERRLDGGVVHRPIEHEYDRRIDGEFLARLR